MKNVILTRFIFIIITSLVCISSQNYSIVENDKFFDKVKNLGRKNIKIPGFNDIFDKFFYSKTDLLKLTVKNIHSTKNQIPYDYTYLDLCNPQNITRPKEGISELLTGKRMSYSNYYFFMNQNETCAWACTKDFKERDIVNYKWLIDRKYHVTYYLDKLPSGYRTPYRKKKK